MSERKLKAWHQAGLIDQHTAERICAWEAKNSRPLGLLAIIGLGVLTIGLGVISVVAANWEAIPGQLRLGVHLGVVAGMASWLWWYIPRGGAREHAIDGALFLTAILGLTFFGHVGQVYQTSSPLWQPLLVWLLLFSPLLLLYGQGWPVAGLWMAGVLGTAWAHADEYGGLALWPGYAVRPSYPALYWGLIACPPMAVAALAVYARFRSTRPAFWRLLEKLALITILAGFSFVVVARGLDGRSGTMLGSVAIQSMALLGASAAVHLARPGKSGQATAAILAVVALLHMVQAMLLYLHPPIRGPWVSALFFLLLWSATAMGALHAQWRRMFQTAIALIALRIVILSFELSDDLLGSGFGLILSGVLALLAAWITIRISQRFAPVAEGQL
ncbi:putative membrane protein [Sphingobium sp. JAI105]|uniref:DUF2157 domain-containing protein n=1 Tax=Sphingobium sp. JAI105 TaxID=2787715 RepID=UPI0018CBD2B7|nr:DUF2157 domain-containing protein [Sphingobium sp. JAI105]MBG6118528.1 putative membrane protein [Sphingobium sp. JAI105]